MASNAGHQHGDDMDYDSDFYGDSQIASDLHHRVEQFDTAKWWQDRKSTPLLPRPSQQRPLDLGHLNNPYEGCPYAWQLTETVDTFLTRLPPASTPGSEDLPWIYICNPHVPRVPKAKAQNQGSRGNENEGPEEEGCDLGVANEGGMARLHLLSDFIQGAIQIGGATPAVMKDVEQQRREAVIDILGLAWQCKVRCGKWMIFCDPRSVDVVWATVARATAADELGIAAKVAPCPEEGLKNRERLICIYTKDFRDRRDVGRVLQRLRELRLVGASGNILYYKPDIFTYIGLGSGNPWGLRASIYSSRDVFPST